MDIEWFIDFEKLYDWLLWYLNPYEIILFRDVLELYILRLCFIYSGNFYLFIHYIPVISIIFI